MIINITKIYLVTNCYNDPNKVYIGKTINIRDREYRHKNTYGNNITFSFIDEINSLKPENWKPLESYWIEQFRQWGFEVLNKNNGGGGPSFYSKESRSKMSTIKKGYKHTEMSKQKMRKPKSEKHKINLKKPKSKEWCEKLSKRRLGGVGYNKKPIIQYDLEGNFIKEWESQYDASISLNINHKSINNCSKNRTKTAGGFIWKYKEINSRF
jgi:hypothetical protein